MSADIRMSLNSSTSRGSGNILPPMLKSVQNAKAVLMQCGASGDSLLSHLSNVIAKALDEGAPNVVDYFEQFSQKVRVETFRMNDNVLEEGYKEPDRLTIAQKLLPILLESFKKPSSESIETEEELGEDNSEEDDESANETEPPTQTFAELQLYWNMLGIGFPREEIFSLQQAILRAAKNTSISSYRFWGKLLGLKNDYYVLECSLSEASLECRIVS